MKITPSLLIALALSEEKGKLRQFTLLNYVVIQDPFNTTNEIIERRIKKRGKKLMKVSKGAGSCSWQVQLPKSCCCG